MAAQTLQLNKVCKIPWGIHVFALANPEIYELPGPKWVSFHQQMIRYAQCQFLCNFLVTAKDGSKAENIIFKHVLQINSLGFSRLLSLMLTESEFKKAKESKDPHNGIDLTYIYWWITDSLLRTNIIVKSALIYQHDKQQTTYMYNLHKFHTLHYHPLSQFPTLSIYQYEIWIGNSSVVIYISLSRS